MSIHGSSCEQVYEIKSGRQVNIRYPLSEQATFYTELRRHRISPTVLNALTGVPDRRVAITRA